MEAVLFEVVTKSLLLIGSVVALIWWFNAGCPFYIMMITRR